MNRLRYAVHYKTPTRERFVSAGKDISTNFRDLSSLFSVCSSLYLALSVVEEKKLFCGVSILIETTQLPSPVEGKACRLAIFFSSLSLWNANWSRLHPSFLSFPIAASKKVFS